MTENKNALAKLAERLEADIGIIRAFQKDLGDKKDEVGGMAIRDIDKAGRIVVKLASHYEPCFPAKSGDDVIDECRAIAEEGANNGK